MNITVTTTTINVPYLVDDYITDIRKYNTRENINFVITGDKKTPVFVKEYCFNLQQKYNIPIYFMDVDDQESYLMKYPLLKGYLPWNCIQRRQVAILKAYENGADIIVLIDDDNYIACENYVSKHLHLGTIAEMLSVQTKSGWYNICDDLTERQGRKFYPRGYSWSDRIEEDKDVQWAKKIVTPVVNAGFWLGDPDIDAVTRLAAPIDVVGYAKNENYVLEKGIFSPFNSQNTAIHREIVPAYFLVPDIGRFDDIWASYVIERIAWHLDRYISYGQPLVRQNRNTHDLWVDAYAEEMGTKMTTDFCHWLRQIELTKNTWLDCGIELFTKLKELVDSLSNKELPAKNRAYINQFIDGYNIWFRTMQQK